MGAGEKGVEGGALFVCSGAKIHSENLHFASAAFLFPYHLKGVALVAELPAMYLKDLL